MTTFLALYRGNTISDARMVAVSARPELVSYVAGQMLDEPDYETDPVISEIERSRRRALAMISEGWEPPAGGGE